MGSPLAKRVKTAPRKQPRQARAQETVDAVLAATARLVVSDGYDKMSTNRIALAAGVSIGSLYQYFPSKEAIVAALVERHAQTICNLSKAKLAECVDKPLDVTVRTIVEALVEAQAVNPKLDRALREQVPRIGKLRLVDDIHNDLIKAVAGYLSTRQESLTIRDPELAAFFVVKALDGIHHEINNPVLAKRTRQELIEEMVRLAVAYLRQC